jgi:hypothetical protein
MRRGGTVPVPSSPFDNSSVRAPLSHPSLLSMGQASNYETDQNYVHEQTFCLYVGCMDTNGLNYDQSATNGGPCDQPVHGCEACPLASSGLP